MTIMAVEATIARALAARWLSKADDLANAGECGDVALGMQAALRKTARELTMLCDLAVAVEVGD